MSSSFKSIVTSCVPPVALRAARRCVRRAIYTGDYATWADARARCEGYDSPAIFEKTLAAARAVRDGRAAFERDTVLFLAPEAHWPVLSGVLRAAALNRGHLQVVDFGGAFGSTWWQHRAWLSGLAGVTWEVVEQAHLVAAGRREFECGPLRFHERLDACNAEPAKAVLLLSSVLPYLEFPHDLLAEAAARGFRQVLIDRTGFVSRGRDRLTVQRVPRWIYPASYPSWFFDWRKLLQPLEADYDVVAEWPTFGEVDIAAEVRGVLLERKTR